MIDISHLCKSFAGQIVLDDITCHFEGGKIHGIVGNNGSVKTVLMKCICGFLIPDSGVVQVGASRWAERLTSRIAWGSSSKPQASCLAGQA